jgi:poly-gamma-glutamate biosynthesis protein PgsC/CapC
MIGASVTIGIIFSFFVSELTGLLAGGLVGPGYLALYLDQPWRVAATLFIAGITYLIVRILSNYFIIYGRRRFMALVLVGMLAGWVAGQAVAWLPGLGQDLRVVGYIIPGLIANDAYKQGFFRTAITTLAVAAMVRLALFIIY